MRFGTSLGGFSGGREQTEGFSARFLVTACTNRGTSLTAFRRCLTTVSGAAAGLLLSAICTFGQLAPDWQARVRRYSEAGDWTSAMRIVEEEVMRAPDDMDVRAWRARVLTWSGRLAEAETEYVTILKVASTDPDIWLGLATLYGRQGNTEGAIAALNVALKLDPRRADLHAARGRVLRSRGERNEARLEFEKALLLDPASAEARMGLLSLRAEPKHELRLGEDNDLYNFAPPNRGEWVSLISRWTPLWRSAVAGSLYQRGGTDAEKFLASITARSRKWGALSGGGALGSRSGIIPKNEAFFDWDHGWTRGESTFVRGIEFNYGQHWYWYDNARILTCSGAAIVYLPREWTASLTAVGARNAFSGTGIEWRPSGIARLGFPLAKRAEKRLSGNVVFAAGTEDFARVDQIGAFASHSYGAGMRLDLTLRQDVTGYALYQQRTQQKTDTSFGFTYGIHF